MHGILKSFAASAATVVITMGLIAASAQFARAQDTDWQNRATGSDVADQPDKAAPLDLAGCWSGSLASKKFGGGAGFLFFDQNGGKAVPGSGAGIDTSGVNAEGPVTGTIKKKSFSVSFKGKKCSVRFSGGLPSSELVGNYHYKCDGEQDQGSFTFTFDSSGDSCN
jgi:hypothetical protein